MAELGPLTGRLLLAVAVVTLLIAGRLLYNVFLHPLRSYPGPWYATSSILWFLYHMARGTHHEAVHALHLRYGAVVRIAPGELSFVEPGAWRDIYGHGNKPEFIKDPSTTYSEDPEHANILVAPVEKHAKLRRTLAHAFSDRSLHSQEAVMNEYAMLLVKGLGECGSEPVDIVRWYNYMTFDVIGHLAFAESFDCLSTSAYHPWVSLIFSTIRLMAWTRALGRLAPALVPALLRLVPSRRTMREYRANGALTREKLARRRARAPGYVDFAEQLLRSERAGALREADLLSNLPLLVVAGSETTASALAGATYYLLSRPRAYARLAAEVRARFAGHADVTLPRVAELTYLPAVIDETLRLYPPANSNHPRLLPPRGATICGRFVPGGTLVGIGHWACFRSPLNFARPEEFIPERFLGGDEDTAGEFANDRREALQPFHVGPRNCIGRNLAQIELRLVLIHLLLAYDLELQPESRGWKKQQVFAAPLKPPLMVKLRPFRKS
ncbi:hypothetical protein SAMD00023353_0900110 [Rosellinia necatrix]|uniref:Cytochrome P450 n=1 Tax=Rosellinia necatrix TaxID=77044 RepID=A0A1W2THF1_ROSNE|nr:hypothetical protein SAMD00023353_0900110 [Rosellinia necatrix]